jgi:hypothetical protein
MSVIYKPFESQKALDGAPIMTRDGRAAKVVHFTGIETQQSALVVEIEGEVELYSILGKLRGAANCETGSDLVMKPKIRTMFAAIWPAASVTSGGRCGDVFASQSALASYEEANPGCAIVRIELQE